MTIAMRFEPAVAASEPLCQLQSAIEKLYNTPDEDWEPLAVAAQLAYCQYMSGG